MCGRYSLTTPPEVLAALFKLADIPAWTPRYNIAPTQEVPVVRVLRGRDETSAERRFDALYWGFIPWWSKDAGVGAGMINARAETAAQKPAFRDAFQRRRCLVPADGFYEWKKLDRGKQPYCIRRHDREPFAFAGLWDRWRGEDEQTIESFTILTTDPTALVRSLHDRMPLILDPKDFDLWLDPDMRDPERLQTLLKAIAAASEDLVAYPVSPRVNTPANDDPACLQAVVPVDESEPRLF
ncbi:MAG: SOS response-associated peptidase [Planctomycetota bacterium]|jgi:putative SOS response-associated peptidase YedK